jgi:hypothetical protein
MFMMSWPFLLCLAYFWVLITGVGLSFTTHKQPRRRNIRIATAALTTPVWLALGFFGFVWFMFVKEPPTLTELQRDFSSKRADLEMILVMSDEDVNFSRIAPDFLDRTPDEPNGLGRYMANDPKAGLSKSRWDSYRKIYSRNGIKLGIQRDAARDAFIMVDSVGFLDQGHITGYLHCAPSAPAYAYRYEPCTLQQEKGERQVDGDSGQEGYSFQKLDDRWYAYDEGPS